MRPLVVPYVRSQQFPCRNKIKCPLLNRIIYNYNYKKNNNLSCGKIIYVKSSGQRDKQTWFIYLIIIMIKEGSLCTFKVQKQVSYLSSSS